MTIFERSLDYSNIHQITEEIGEVLDRPVIIENRNFELVAYSSPEEFPFDPSHQKTILTKKCPLVVIERLKKDGIILLIEKENKPIRIHPIEDISFFDRVAISLKYKEEHIGILWIHEKTKMLTNEELNFLTKIASRVGKLLFEHLQSYKKLEVDKKQQILLKLVNQEYVSEQQIEKEAEVISYSIPKRYVVIVFSITNPSYLYILKNIQEVINGYQFSDLTYNLGKGTDLIVLIGGNELDIGSATNNANILVDYIVKSISDEEFEVLYIGIGQEYTKLRNTRKSFLQALEVIETTDFLNSNNQVPFEYANLGAYKYLKSIFEKKRSVGFKSRVILQLMQKDEETQSELLKTLFVYLCNNGKLKNTADELFIHPNTLNYRIKQIVELTNINLDDFHLKTELYIELLLIYNIPDYLRGYKETVATYT